MADDLVNQCIAELQDLVRCRCHPAYTGRGLHDPDCECDSAEAVRVVTDRIEDLEAQNEFLQQMIANLPPPHPDNTLRNRLAQRRAQLKGDTND